MDDQRHPLHGPSIERLTSVEEALFEKLHAAFPEVEWDRGNLEAFLRDPRNILLVARIDDEIGGTLRAHTLSRYDPRGPEILLNEIDVVAVHLRKGVATSLVESLKTIARSMGASEIWVPTNRSNTAAVALYGKTGGVAAKEDDVVFVYPMHE